PEKCNGAREGLRYIVPQGLIVSLQHAPELPGKFAATDHLFRIRLAGPGVRWFQGVSDPRLYLGRRLPKRSQSFSWTSPPDVLPPPADGIHHEIQGAPGGPRQLLIARGRGRMVQDRQEAHACPARHELLSHFQSDAAAEGKSPEVVRTFRLHG